MPTSKAVIHTDGASSGNPGPAGIGAVIEFRGATHELSEYIGEATNNVAEYTALVRALEEARRLGAQSVHVYMDSELVVRQVGGRYKVKNEGLRPIYERAMTLLRSFRSYKAEHVPRERNTEADRLSKLAVERPQQKQNTSNAPMGEPRQGELF